jgi:DNA primase large subunit
VDDVGVPVTPEYSADDLTRVDSIKLRHRDAQELATFLTNLRLDLDEYVRTKKAMDDSKMHDAETYQIS